MPFGITIGSDKIFSNANGRSLMYRLEKNGIEIQPWRTPLDCVMKGSRLSLTKKANPSAP